MARWHSEEYYWWPKSGPLANRRLNNGQRTETDHYLVYSTCNPFKYTVAVPYLLYQYEWENPSEFKGLKIHQILKG